MIQSQYFETHSTGEVTCTLCPHLCKLKDQKRGNCGVRINRNGLLYSENYGRVTAIHFDPIEKKPLYHFYPGSQILSIGTLGCNLSCQFCQNFEISQANFESHDFSSIYSPEEVLKVARSRSENIGISFTYNEPTIWYEFVKDVSQQSREYDMVTTMVTNGFINSKPLASLLPYLDAFNVDLKAFTDDFYRKYTSSLLSPVKDSILQIKDAGKHIEITNLVIPDLNDDPKTFREMVSWISREVGENTVLHLSRYFPVYKMSIPRTSMETLQLLYTIAREYLTHVFYGNVSELKNGRDTICPACNAVAITREGYYTRISGLNQDGKCSNCGKKIIQHYRIGNTNV